MATEKILIFDEAGNAKRMKVRIARFLDNEPVTSSDKENIRETLGVDDSLSGTFTNALSVTSTNNSSFTGDGKVGIGTSSPDQLIHASSSTGASLRLERDSATITSGQSYGAIEWEGQDASGGGAASGVRAKIETEATGSSGDAALKFYTAAANDVATERATIDSSGNVNVSSGQMQVISGAASAPSYAFDGDTDTGLSRPTTNAVNIVTGGTERLRVGSSGQLSVGASGGAISAADDDAALVLQRSVGGIAELSRATNTDGHVVGKINFANRNNSNTVNPGSANYPAVAGIEAQLETTDSNADDDSGGHLVFKTKPEAGLLATRVTIGSSGDVSVGGTTFAAGKLRVEDNNGNHVWLKGRSSDGNSSVSFRNNADSAYNGRIAVDDSTGMNFQVAGSTRWTINTTGNLVAGANLGIDFGSVTTSAGDGIGTTGSASNSVLSDYEFGSWTPEFSTSGADFTTMTMDVLAAQYCKVGRHVHCQAYIRTDNVDATGASGGVIVQGLPFLADATTGNYATLNVGYSALWVNAPAAGYVQPNAPYVRLTRYSTTGAPAILPSDLTAGASADKNELIFTVSYISKT